MTALTNSVLLLADAKNRTLRTFLTSLVVDVGIAVTLLFYNVFNTATSWDSLDWKIIGFSLAKTVVVSAGTFVLRRFLDKSSFPTPLPPAPVAAPADTTPGT